MLAAESSATAEPCASCASRKCARAASRSPRRWSRLPSSIASASICARESSGEGLAGGGVAARGEELRHRRRRRLAQLGEARRRRRRRRCPRARRRRRRGARRADRVVDLADSRCSSVGGASLISALGGGVVGVRVEAIDESECARRWPGVVCGGFMYGGGSASSPPGLNKFGNSVMRGDAPVTERGDSDGLDGSTRALLRGDESTLRVAWTFSSGLKRRSSSPRGVSGDDGGVGVSLSSGIGRDAVDGAGQDVTGCSEMTTRRSRAPPHSSSSCAL